MKIIVKVEIEFDNWHEDGTSPQTKDEWKDFMDLYFLPDKFVLGVQEVDKAIMVDSYELQVVKIVE